jgi:hypothetical protein
MDSAPPVAAGGGEAPVPDAPGNPLADTEWRLVQFQSMDDAIGTIEPDDPSVYAMRLNGDGTVTMQLGCNRGTGTWSVEPSEDGQSGRFEFGPLAVTRALCPPPSMDERIAADAEHVSGYLLRDGRLYLSLMADAGIYAWERNADADGESVPFEMAPDPQLEAAILQAEPDYTQAVVDIDGREGRYVYGKFDLNGDGADEVLVFLLGSIFCGSGGCNLLLFSAGEEGYALVDEFPITRMPVIAAPDMTAGWRDLIRMESGGGAEASYVRHVFNGDEYVEKERMSADTTPEGTQLFAGDYSYATGFPLQPLE